MIMHVYTCTATKDEFIRGELCRPHVAETSPLNACIYL